MSDVYREHRPQIPLFVYGLAITMVAAFLFTGQYDPARLGQLIYNYGLVPSRYDPSSSQHFQNWLAAIPPLLTHPFVHGGWISLSLNVFWLVIAGPVVSRRVGEEGFLVVFFVSAVGGAIAFLLAHWGAEGGTAGAGGAVCGVFAANILSSHSTPMDSLRDPAVMNQLFWFVLLNVFLLAGISATNIVNIAWQSNFGGFIAGGLAYYVIAPRPRKHGPWG